MKNILSDNYSVSISKPIKRHSRLLLNPNLVINVYANVPTMPGH